MSTGTDAACTAPSTEPSDVKRAVTDIGPWARVWKPPLSWLWQLALVAGLLALLAALVDFPAAIEAAGNADPILFAAAVGLALSAWLVNSVKWWLLLRPLDRDASLPQIIDWNMRAVFYGQLLPGMLAGEAVKGYRLYRQTGTAAPAVVSIGGDRVTGLAALAILASMALIRSPDLRSDPVYIALLVALGIAVPIALLTLFTRAGLSLVARLQRYRLLGGLARRGSEVIAEYEGRYSLMAVALALSLVFQTLGAMSVYALAEGADLSVELVDWLWVYAAVSFVTLLPIAFGGLGAREGAFIILLAPLGVESEAALSLGLLVLGVQLALAGLGAGLELRAALWSAPRHTKGEPANFVLQSQGRKVKP